MGSRNAFRWVGIAALATSVMVAAPASAWAIGFGAEVGRVEVRSGADGTSTGVFGRLGLIGPLQLELDLAKTDFDEQTRSDTRFGAGLRLEIIHIGRFIPAVMAGVGIIKVDAPGWQGELDYTELGVGLVFELTRNVRLEADFRWGDVSVLEATNDPDEVPRAVMPEAGDDSYRAGRLGVSIAF